MVPRAVLCGDILTWLLRGDRLEECTDQDPDWRLEGVYRNKGRMRDVTG